MDILTLEAVTGELQQQLAGARIDKIFQPTADILIFRLWNGRQNLRLLISTAPGSPRIHFTDQEFPNPPAPPRFCQLLRSRISRIREIHQIAHERILHVHCQGGEQNHYQLIVELLGRRSNLVLVDGEGNIVDVLKREKQGAEGRALLPGQPYVRPAPRALLALAEVKALPIELGDARDISQWLFRQVSPMSSFVAEEVAAGLDKGRPLEDLVGEIVTFRNSRQYSPVVGRLRGKPFISPFPVAALSLEDHRVFSSPSQAAEYYYSLVLHDAGGVGEQRALLQLVGRREARALRRLQQIQAEDQKQSEVERLREAGELLLANLWRISSGMTSVELEDYYCDPPQPRILALDARISPAENAEHYFRRYKKAKRAAEHISRRLKETRQELEWLASVKHALEQAVEPLDIAVIRSELEEEGLLGSQRRIEKRAVADIGRRVHSTLSPGGYRILWGRNNRTNDLVTRELADGQDWWFHAHRIPGCHLILKLRHKSETVPEADLHYAAALAAGYSRAAESDKVEVMVARAAEVRKPPGARPGMVTVRKYKTLMVSPEKQENSN
jgi:predicted ribosome quality control (RQC) complex YloA/Tae2 family protein